MKNNMKSNNANNKEKQEFHFFKILCRIAPMVYSVFPVSFLIVSLVSVFHGMARAVMILTNQRLYDAISLSIFNNGAVSSVYWAAAVVCLVIVAHQISSGLDNFFLNVFITKAKGKLALDIHKKTAMLPAMFFENKKELDNINKAIEGENGAVELFIYVVRIFTFNLPYFIFLAFYLFNVRPLLLVCLLMAFVPALFSQIVRTKVYAKLENESASIRRRNDHYEKCLCSRETMKETRLLGGFAFFRKLYVDTIDLLSQKEWTADKKICMIDLGLNIFKAIGYVGMLILLFSSLMDGSISIGVFTALLPSFDVSFFIIEDIIRRVDSSISKNLGKVQNFIDFLDLPIPDCNNAEPDFDKGIILNNVDLTYPYADKPSLNGVSLKIKKGETLAIVGENGSGKTTLAKILMGLYKPDAGEAIIGGSDTKITCEKALFSKTSGVFQNYVKYAMSLLDNVRISDFYSDANTENVLKSAGIEPTDNAIFPEGLDTVLFREFNGVDLSGGQWQRVAIARGLYRIHDFIILDEPTAAIDPIEEVRMYKNFMNLASDTTCIIITHRLGSVRIADRIAVMDNGKIVETGIHEELIKNNGKYAKMWSVQAQYYQ